MWINNWQILEEAGKDKNRKSLTRCQCKCGKIKLIPTGYLYKKRPNGCNDCRKISNMKKKHIGKKFNMLTILDQIPGKKSVCKCDCGNIKTCPTAAVLNGQYKSCGCIRSIHRSNYDISAKEKLLKSIKVDDKGCWIWQKSKSTQGYGHFPYKRRVIAAHRASWIFHNGKIPQEILVLHKCDNPPCCNPDHLFLGNDKINALDKESKNRGNHAKGERNAHSKLKNSQVVEIVKLLSDGESMPKIASKFNVSLSCIKFINQKRSWRHIQRPEKLRVRTRTCKSPASK